MFWLSMWTKGNYIKGSVFGALQSHLCCWNLNLWLVLDFPAYRSSDHQERETLLFLLWDFPRRFYLFNLFIGIFISVPLSFLHHQHSLLCLRKATVTLASSSIDTNDCIGGRVKISTIESTYFKSYMPKFIISYISYVNECKWVKLVPDDVCPVVYVKEIYWSQSKSQWANIIIYKTQPL